MKYIHVSIDTFSGFILATLQAGEATKHVIAHLLHCLGIPKQIKTDNGLDIQQKPSKHFVKNYKFNMSLNSL